MKPRLHLLALASLALLSQAHAQSAQSNESGNKLERVEVTGSMIKRTDSETTSPVTIIKREDILRAGATTLDELLRMDPSMGSGGLDDIGTGNGFAAGTARRPRWF